MSGPPQDPTPSNGENKGAQQSIINDLPTDERDIPAGQSSGKIINDTEEAKLANEESGPRNASQEPDAPVKSQLPVFGTDYEIDLWWGSYSIWGMTPSLTICVLLTTGIIAAALAFADREYRQLIIVALAGAVWLMQLPRVFFRVFGYTHRLTTRRLYVNRGWVSSAAERIDLVDIKNVQLVHSWWGEPLKVGRIVITSNDPKSKPIELHGVRNPERVVKRIQNTARQAKESA